MYKQNNENLTGLHGGWCRHILQWWLDHRFEFPGLNGLAGYTFCVMATSGPNERMFTSAVSSAGLTKVVNVATDAESELLGHRGSLC